MFFLRLIFLSGILFLSGCSVFSPVPANQETKYQIDSVPSLSAKKHPAKTLMVFDAEASSVYSGTGIAYSDSPYTVAYFSKSRWAEPPAKMLNQVIIQILQKSRAYRVVVTPAYTGSYDYGLNTQLIELKQDFTMSPTSVVRLKMNVTLSRASTGRVIAAKQFSIVVPARYNTPYGGVLAANEAVRRLAVQMVEFCEKNSR